MSSRESRPRISLNTGLHLYQQQQGSASVAPDTASQRDNAADREERYWHRLSLTTKEALSGVKNFVQGIVPSPSRRSAAAATTRQPSGTRGDNSGEARAAANSTTSDGGATHHPPTPARQPLPTPALGAVSPHFPGRLQLPSYTPLDPAYGSYGTNASGVGFGGFPSTPRVLGATPMTNAGAFPPVPAQHYPQPPQQFDTTSAAAAAAPQTIVYNFFYQTAPAGMVPGFPQPAAAAYHPGGDSFTAGVSRHGSHVDGRSSTAIWNPRLSRSDLTPHRLSISGRKHDSVRDVDAADEKPTSAARLELPPMTRSEAQPPKSAPILSGATQQAASVTNPATSTSAAVAATDRHPVTEKPDASKPSPLAFGGSKSTPAAPAAAPAAAKPAGGFRKEGPPAVIPDDSGFAPNAGAEEIEEVKPLAPPLSGAGTFGSQGGAKFSFGGGGSAMRTTSSNPFANSAFGKK